MNKEAAVIAEEIELLHIDIVNSKINEGSKVVKPRYDLKVAHRTSHNLKDERIRIKILINLLNQPTDGQISEANFEIDFHFKIQHLQNFYTLKEGTNIPVISANLIATILGISFSTARGLLFERLANTNFQGVILPVVSPKKMLETKVEE